MKPFFSENSPFLDHPLLTPERTNLEVEFVLQQLDLSPGAKILDIGCGFGRHSIELASRGFELLGIDPAPAMIVAAQERAEANGAPVQFEVMDATNLSLGQEFDGAICLFTTLGQVNDDQDNTALVEQVGQVLSPNGRLVVEIPNKPWVIANLKPEDKFGDEPNYTRITRSFDPTTSRVTETFDIVAAGQKDTFILQYRIFDAEELTILLTSAHFKLLSLFGDYHGAALNENRANIIAIAQKEA